MKTRRTLFWPLVISAALHLIVLSILPYSLARVLVNPKGARESVAETTTISIDRPAVRQAPAKPREKVLPHHMQIAQVAAVARRELAKEAPIAPPRANARPKTGVSSMERDASNFAKEVAALNKQNDPHAIPTMDPATRASNVKSYSFDVGSRGSDEGRGNGYITTTSRWHDRGLNCYYGRYEYTYADGAEEDGDIAWPFCYEPALDPFRLPPPRLMPFPPPPPGYRLPPGTQLPPLEKQYYDAWAAANA